MGKKKNVFQKVGKQMKKKTKSIDKGIKKGVKKTVPKKIRKPIAKGSKKYSKAYTKIDNKIYKGLSNQSPVLGKVYKFGSYYNPLGQTKTIADVASGKQNVVRALLNETTPVGEIRHMVNTGKRFV